MSKNAPMELAKNYDEKFKAKIFPGYAQIKYDGVPITFKNVDGTIVGLTRQNEEFGSYKHIIEQLRFLLVKPGSSVTMELLVPGKPFKYSSGLVRRVDGDEETATLRGRVFDANLQAQPKETYYIRWQQFTHDYAALSAVHSAQGTALAFEPCESWRVDTIEEVETLYKELVDLHGPLEGIMIHALNKAFNPGKRCWGMCRYKPQPTIDLAVASYEEAVSEDGEPLGMLGRVNVVLRRQGRPASVIGVGPGKLTHAERKSIWEAAVPQGADGVGPSSPHPVPGRMPAYQIFAEIKYMPDPSYDALRQPTIQRLRTDKTESDILVY